MMIDSNFQMFFRIPRQPCLQNYTLFLTGNNKIELAGSAYICDFSKLLF